MDDLLHEFMAETSESLNVVDAELVRFEREPSSVKLLDHVFRLVHSIKGTCSFLNLPRFEALAHATETLLEQLRDGQPATPEMLELIYAAVARMKSVLATLERGNAGTPEHKHHLLPAGRVWKNLPHLVSELALQLYKNIELEIHGADVELDRAVIGLIKDPVMHMVRNAIDHGIEPPDARMAAGKPETGKIRLSFGHKDDYLLIEIADDGKGLDMARIERAVIESGLASRVEIDGLTAPEIMKFIFAPGFTTAANVTPISGRGVGMDVVYNNISRLGGSVDLKSAEGEGTTITIRIPVKASQARPVGGQACVDEDEKLSFIVFRAGEGLQKAIPQLLVTKIENIDAAKIIKTKSGEVIGYRSRLMPLIRAGAMQRQGVLPVLIFTEAGRFLALAVDEIIGIAENETKLEIRSGKPGVIGTAAIKGRMTEVIDIGAYLPCDLKRA
jgi:chemotaxis protein histidine kinase CheA